MKPPNWMSGCAVFVCLCFAGCLSPNVPKPLPKANDAVQIEKLFPMALDAAWDRTLAFASHEGMKVITADKPSGLITFVAIKKGRDSKLYYNVLLQPSIMGSGTMLVVFERTAHGAAFDTTVLDRITRSFTE